MASATRRMHARRWLDADLEIFIGLTGSPATVSDVAAQFSAAFYKTPGKMPGDYLVEHNSQIFLIDARWQAARDVLQCAGRDDGAGDEVDRGRGRASPAVASESAHGSATVTH